MVGYLCVDFVCVLFKFKMKEVNIVVALHICENRISKRTEEHNKTHPISFKDLLRDKGIYNINKENIFL